MIKLENVTYNYKRSPGVVNVNLTVDEGEFVFLIGPTGSGKTTILRLIYMSILPDSGTVFVNKYRSDKIRRRQIPRLRREVGMIFQDYHLLGDRNLFENVALPLHVLGYSRLEIAERVQDVLQAVGLEDKERHYPDDLSGGEQQRACIARALVKEPSILLADEPTGNLDPITSFEFIKLLEEINQEGTTILMASHNYGLIKGRGHRIVEIQEGRLR
ncbi:MAG: cell division ATP-binding protein FtsE [Fidelibacterota bacterium]